MLWWNKLTIGENYHRQEYASVNSGVRHRCPLSPALFNLYIDDITRRWGSELEVPFYNIEIAPYLTQFYLLMTRLSLLIPKIICSEPYISSVGSLVNIT